MIVLKLKSSMACHLDVVDDPEQSMFIPGCFSGFTRMITILLNC